MLDVITTAGVLDYGEEFRVYSEPVLLLKLSINLVFIIFQLRRLWQIGSSNRYISTLNKKQKELNKKWSKGDLTTNQNTPKNRVGGKLPKA